MSISSEEKQKRLKLPQNTSTLTPDPNLTILKPCPSCGRRSLIFDKTIKDFRCLYRDIGCNKMKTLNKNKFYEVRLNKQGRRIK